MVIRSAHKKYIQWANRVQQRRAPIVKIDHGELGCSRPFNAEKSSRLVLLLAPLLSATMIASGISLVILLSEPTSYLPDEQTRLVLAAYTPHSTISVDGDAAFLAKASSEGWPGDGTAGNPIVISGLDIDGSGYRSSIVIGNVSLHFEISGCYLHNAICGVFVYKTGNGTVVNNEFSGNSAAVKLGVTSWSIVAHNNCSGDLVWVDWGNNITIEDNNCSWGGSISVSGKSIIVHDNVCSHNSGISVGGMMTTNITVSGNECTYNQVGIWAGAYGVKVLNNNCTDNSVSGISSHDANPEILGNNCSHNGVGITVDTGSATIKDNVCVDNTGAGIDFGGVGGAVIRNNCSRDQTGVKIIAIAGNIFNVSNNVCSKNTVAGINLTGESLASGRGTIGNNSCIGNSLTGIQLTHFGGKIINNTCSQNGRRGMLLQHVSMSYISENNCSDNAGWGMYFTYMYNFMDGYRVSTFNSISSNIIANNSNGGLLSEMTSHETLSDNHFVGNGRIGVCIKDCGYVTMRGQKMTGEGVLLQGSTIQSWALHDIDSSNLVNGKPIYYMVDGVGGIVPGGRGQVILANCKNIIVQDQVLNNATVGIAFGYCTAINVSYNYCSGGYFGIYLNSTRGCWISSNDIEDNSRQGVNITSGSKNVIWNNTFSQNNGAEATVQFGPHSGKGQWNRQ